jgi:hypothetical protein
MQSTILPEFVQLTDYIYTLLGLTVATLILVINLPHIVKLWQVLQNVQSLFWGWVSHIAEISIRKLFETRNPPDRVRQPDLEMQTGNPGEVVRLEEARDR